MVKCIKFILYAIIAGILLLFLQLYVSFCKFNQIGIDTYTNDTKRYDPKFHIKNVIANYPKTMFLYKGREFQNIPCHEFRITDNKHVVDIKFNWNNTIDYSIDKNSYVFLVDSINIATRAYMPIDTINWKCASEDSIFYCIRFYDKKKNFIEVSRQKRNMPYKGQRNGFCIKRNETDYITGNFSPFDY